MTRMAIYGSEGFDPCPGTAEIAGSEYILRIPRDISNNVEHVFDSMVGGICVDPSELQRRRRLAKLKRQGCGCSMAELCKHYYPNLRTQVKGAEGHTAGNTTDQGTAATALVPTFLDITGMDQVVTPRTSPRLHRLLSRRRQRLSTPVVDKGSARGSRRESAGQSRAQSVDGSAMRAKGALASRRDGQRRAIFKKFEFI